MLLQSELIDFSVSRFPAPAGLWVSNPDNLITDNVVISSEGTGIWNSFANYVCCSQSECTVLVSGPYTLDACQQLHGSQAQLLRPALAPTRMFARNVAASCVVGMNWDGGARGPLANNPRNPKDRNISTIHYAPINLGHTPPVFSDLTIYKSSNTAQYFRGGQSYFERQVRFIWALTPTPTPTHPHARAHAHLRPHPRAHAQAPHTPHP